jgi:hypothetical protein
MSGIMEMEELENPKLHNKDPNESVLISYLDDLITGDERARNVHRVKCEISTKFCGETRSKNRLPTSPKIFVVTN